MFITVEQPAACVGADTERAVGAYRETARDFVGVAARLVRLDDHTFGYALDPDAAEIRVSEESADVPVSSCIDPVDLEIGILRRPAPHLEGRRNSAADRSTVCRNR